MNQARALHSQRGAAQAALLIASAIGLCVVLGTLWLQSNPPPAERFTAPSVEYGRQLIRDTARNMGPAHEDPGMRYTGTSMDCASCHLDTGTRPGTLSLLQAAQRYPRFSGRDGRVGDLRDRINGCMTRSMNGKELDRESVQMRSMEMYIRRLNQQYAVMGESRQLPDEPPTFSEPDRAADVAAGEVVFEANCAVCHGADGQRRGRAHASARSDSQRHAARASR